VIKSIRHFKIKLHGIAVILLVFAVVLSACVKDEEGYSDYILNYLDSVAAEDTIPVSIDKPCDEVENRFHYAGNFSHFNTFYCFDEDDFFKIKATNDDNDFSMWLYFFKKPEPGKYVTEYYLSLFPGEVYITYAEGLTSLVSHGYDTVYVERLSGGIYSITLCDVRMDFGAGGYYTSGNITCSLGDCD